VSLLIVRHGETALNVSRTLQPADTPLSPQGLAQAEALARRIAGLAAAGIVSSDLPRALRTAQAIAAATGLPIVTSALLQERNFGDLRGLPYDSLGYDPMTMTDAPPGGESAEQFRCRAAAGFAWLVAQRRSLGGPLVVVSHGLLIRAWLERHALLRQDGPLPAKLSNTSLTVLSALPPHTVERLDCTAHLDAATRADRDSLSGG
jgi:probable phosphoglycerate mutase